MGETSCRPYGYSKGQAPKSDIPPNIAPKVVTPENYLRIWDSSATLIGQLAIVTLFGAILGGIPLSGPYPIQNMRAFISYLNGITIAHTNPGPRKTV